METGPNLKRGLSDSTVVLAAGGTGGHMFPAEALASELKRRGARVVLVTDARGRRYTEKFPADDIIEISAASPSIGGPVAKAAAGISIMRGLVTTLRAFRQREIAAAVGFGGYPSLPAMKAASLMKIPYGVHEQNSVLGRANRLLVKQAAFTAHAFPDLERTPSGLANRYEVGNPVRDAVRAAAGVPYNAPASDEPIRLLIFGGSQGAALFSRIVPLALAGLPMALRRRLAVVHQARDEEGREVHDAYTHAGITAEVASFFGDLPARLAEAHLVIARSGASTVTELASIGRPSILVPLAIAMDDHQHGNARTLAGVGAGEIILERNLTVDILAERLGKLLGDPVRLAAMAEAARGRMMPGASARLADLVEQVIAQAHKNVPGDAKGAS